MCIFARMCVWMHACIIQRAIQVLMMGLPLILMFFMPKMDEETKKVSSTHSPSSSSCSSCSSCFYCSYCSSCSHILIRKWPSRRRAWGTSTSWKPCQSLWHHLDTHCPRALHDKYSATNESHSASATSGSSEKKKK